MRQRLETDDTHLRCCNKWQQDGRVMLQEKTIMIGESCRSKIIWKETIDKDRRNLHLNTRGNEL